MKKILYFLSFLLLLTSCSGKKDDKTISIGYINWDDGIALTYLTEVILEQQGYHVVLKNADPAPIYATMARGKVDLLMDAWLPATQADYMKQYGKESGNLRQDLSGCPYRSGSPRLCGHSFH